MTHSILRLPEIKRSTGLARSTIYLRIAQGAFTKPVKLGGRAAGWPASEVEALNAARIAGKSDAEVRDLVAALEAARKAVKQVEDLPEARRRPNSCLVKIQRNHPMEEVACVFSIHENSLRECVKAGLSFLKEEEL